MVVNQKFIAREAGVSQKTVSLYFQNRDLVGAETRSKIGTVVEKYNYIPNLAACSIKNRKFSRIACLVLQQRRGIYSLHPQIPAYLNGINTVLAPAGYSLVFEPVYIDLVNLYGTFPEFFDSLSVDGIIGIPGCWLPPVVDERVAKLSVPTVWLNREAEPGGTPTLVFDEVAGARLLAESILRSGCRRVAWFGPDYTRDIAHHYSSRVRFETLRDLLADGGAELTVSRFARVGEPLAIKAGELAEARDAFDLLVSYNFDYRDSARWEALRQGLSLVDYPMLHWASNWERGLACDLCSCLVLPEYELGQRGAEYILRRIRGEPVGGLLEPASGTMHWAASEMATALASARMG